MFATYAKSTMSKNTYEQISEFKKNKTGSLTQPLQELTSTVNCVNTNKNLNHNKKQKKTLTDFQKYYTRGDFPVSISFNGANRALTWLVHSSKVDLTRYLPLFLLGLVETEEPYAFIGERTSLEAIKENGDKLKDILPDLILASYTLIPSIVLSGLAK